MKKSLLVLATASALLPAVNLHAQAAVRALPRVATDTFGGATNFSIPPIPFRAQYWFSSENLPQNLVISQLGLRIAPNTAAPVSSRQIELVVSDNATAFAGLTANFAANQGASPSTFFARRTVNFPAFAPTTDPNSAAAWFPGDAPFVHLSGGLVVEFRAGASNNPAVVPNDAVVIPGSGSRSIHRSGRPSCGARLRAGLAGSSMVWSAAGLPSGVPVTFNLGIENVSLGGVGLPLDLAGIGLPGCHLGIESITSANLVSSSAGTVRLSLPYTVAANSTLTISAQAVHGRIAQPQQPSDFATTNVVTSALGSVGLCNALFATPDTAPNAQQGPFPDNRSVVLLVR